MVSTSPSLIYTPLFHKLFGVYDMIFHEVWKKIHDFYQDILLRMVWMMIAYSNTTFLNWLFFFSFWQLQ